MIDPDAQLDGTVEVEDTPEDYGRVGAQTARQVITQRLREAEKGRMYSEYADKEGELLTAVVQRIENGYVYVELGTLEGVIPPKEQIAGEQYIPGSRVKVYVSEVKKVQYGATVTVSRTHPQLIKRLFELEVPEINDGLITIKKIARIPGKRAKIAVETYDERIDPVGACVGVKGSRIHGIVRELRNENIDVIPYTSNIELFIKRALSPAKIQNITIDEEKNVADVNLKKEEVSLAIGKDGMNIKLASMITEHTINVYREVDEQQEDDIYLDEFTDEIEEWVIEAIKKLGYDTAKAVLNAPREVLIEKADLEEDTVDHLLEVLKAEFENED
jgi:N utilization substance protein A